MDAHRFDALARALSRPAPRRAVGRSLGAALLGGLLARGGAKRAAAAPPCRAAGHPCAGHQACCDGLACARPGPGAAKRCAAAPPPPPPPPPGCSRPGILCSNFDPCCAPSVCTQGTCCVPQGGACTVGTDCCVDVATFPFTGCALAEDGQALTCQSCRPTGQGCATNADCCSGRCAGGSCAGCLSGMGGPCATTADCCAGCCGGGGLPTCGDC